MNMDILAENRFLLTKDLFLEGIRRVDQESYGKFAKKIAAALAAVWLAMAAATLWTGGSLAFAVTEGLVAALAAVWVCVLLPRSRAKRAFKALENRYGTDMERVVRFYPDRLEVETAETQTVIPRDQLRQLLRSKRLLVLLTAEKKGVLLKRDSFTLGDETAIENYIRKENIS